MSRSTVLEATDAGATVVMRATEADAAVLRRAGERLLAAAHPGVVEVLSSTGSEQAWELRTLHAGRPLDTLEGLGPEAVAHLMAATAATLADLHANGIVHGCIDASHVLLGPHGRPILCGFAISAEAEPADDVAALGSLIVSLVGEDAGEPIPERRWRHRGSRDVWLRRSLLLLADQCSAEPPTRRPTSARLAAAIAESCGLDAPAPVATPSSSPSPSSSSRSSSPSPSSAGSSVIAVRARALAWALVGGVALLAAAVRLAPSRDLAPAPVRPAVASSSTDASADADIAEVPSTTATPAGPPTRCLPPPADPAGCADVVIHGHSVMVGDRHYEVGQHGDRVVLGDWDCDGILTPVALRPSSGDVFVFDLWAGDAADEVVAPARARVQGAQDLHVERGANGCGELVVQRADGSGVKVDLRGER